MRTLERSDDCHSGITTAASPQFFRLDMDIAYLSALAALAGSVVGGLTTGLSAWTSQRAQMRTALLAHKISQREDLFRDFIVSASKTYGEAIVSSEPQLSELVGLYGMVSRMRVLCSARTVACAERAMLTTLDTFFKPNRTLQELHETIKGAHGINVLQEFSEAARDELRALAP
jgi:hypothetical protein